MNNQKIVSDLQSAWAYHFHQKKVGALASRGGRVHVSGATVIDKVDVNPTDLGPLVNMNLPLFNHMTLDDFNQRTLADCWFLSPLGCLVNASTGSAYIRSIMYYDPSNPQQVIVQFVRNSIITRIHCDLLVATSGNAVNPADADIYVEIFEKAYADYRTVTDAFHQLDMGFPYAAMMDLGLTNVTMSYTPSVTIAQIKTALDAGRVVSFCTSPTGAGLGLISSHCYMVIACDGVNITARNPWGISYPPVTLSLNQAALVTPNVAHFAFGTIPPVAVVTPTPATYTQAQLDAAVQAEKLKAKNLLAPVLAELNS